MQSAPVKKRIGGALKVVTNQQDCGVTSIKMQSLIGEKTQIY